MITKIITKGCSMNLEKYNKSQRVEIQRVYDEIKWHLGVEKGYDPYMDPECKAIIEERLANIILNGFGSYLRELATKKENYTGSDGV
jgi:hypothetical protein